MSKKEKTSSLAKSTKSVVGKSTVVKSAATSIKAPSETEMKEVGECNKPVPEGYTQSTTGHFDCHAYLIHCGTHNRVLVTRRHAQWMPFVEMPPNRTWEDGARIGFCIVLAGDDKERFQNLKQSPPYSTFKCMHLMRIQIPQTLKFIRRTVYYFKLDPEAKSLKCCQPISGAEHLEWISVEDITSGKMSRLWGPELAECCKGIDENIKQKVSEFSMDEAFLFVPRDPPRNLEEDMLKSLNITQTVIERLYADYLDHCFPSFYQTLESFRAYMSKYKFERDESRLGKLFNAFNIGQNGRLSFHELLLGFACMEPAARHGEFRVRFIFRYYDFNQSGSLDEDKLRAIVADMSKADQVEDKLAEIIQAIGGGTTEGLAVSETDFLSAIGAHKFRGTSILCRLQKSIFAEISRHLAMQQMSRVECNKVLTSALPKRSYPGVCPTCLQRKYELATHHIVVNSEGKKTTKRLAGVEKAKPSTENEAPKNTESPNALTAHQYSLEYIFKPYSTANALIMMLHVFAKNKGTAREPFGIMNRRAADLWKLLLQLYRELNVILEPELKCHKAYSPCYVIGDIHGNLEDLMSLEKKLWPLMPVVGANFIFLGDYVDRGAWGLECAIYIAAFKLLCPNKVTMLRGNHEVRSLQKHYSYYKECILKYGETYGLKIWEITNRIFDRLPVCALLDDTIFCCHGGIPHAAKTIEQITKVKRVICEPDKEALIAWEILWSDPANQQEFLDTCEVRKVNPETANGFVFNTKRGTAFKFNEEGANIFFQNNMLTHIIRAHEVAFPGYVFHFVNKCVTIFSHYCGNDNECGFILADNHRLRVIVMDTANNASATE